MAAGDTLRKITPNDQFILDASGNVVGVKNPNANGADLRFDPSSVAITGGGTVDLLGVKLRRLATAAAASNPLTNPPLTLAPAWVAATAYSVGNVVTSGGNQYICYTAGTSAGSGGPSGTGAALITDNTVSWHYLGNARISAASPLAPSYSISTSTPAGLGTLYSPITNASSFLFAGGTPTPGPGGYSALVAFPSTTVGATGGNTGYGNGTSSSGGYATFETDAPKVAIGTNNSSRPARIVIDGQYYNDGGDSSNGGNPAWRVLDFSAAGGRKTRRITIETDEMFAGVRVDPQSMVWAPQVNDAVKVAVLGSSIEAGGNSYPIIYSSAWCKQLGKLMGWSDVRNLGIGGTGYVNPGTNLKYADHLSDATSFAPDIVIVGGPINDTAGAALQSAALSLYQQIRAALPNAIIIAGGTFPAATGPGAAALASEANILTAVTAFADPYTFFVPIANDSQGSWISGTGKVTATTGVGNADVYISADGTHPTQAAIDYHARRWAAVLRQKVLPALI